MSQSTVAPQSRALLLNFDPTAAHHTVLIDAGAVEPVARLSGIDAMGLMILALFIALAVAGALGWGANSRDFADWRPSDGGFRRSPRDP